MDWPSELRTLREELDPFRRERARLASLENEEYQERLGQLRQMFQSLDIERSLRDLNRELLDDMGEVEVFAPWDPPPAVEDDANDNGEDEAEEDEDEVEEDVVSAVLSWDENGSCEIGVDMGLAERSIYLQVNGTEIRPEAEAVRQALIKAFREEIGI